MALARNAVNPNDGELAFGTTNFCFRSLDVYHVEGRAVVNDVAGAKEAEAAVRQVIEVGADAETSWVLDSQSDFELGLALGAGGKYIETYPFNVGYVSDKLARQQPRPRAQQMVERKIYPSDERGVDIGDVRLQASRLKLFGSPVLEEHFDGSYYADGWWTPESGAYQQPVKKYLRKSGTDDPYVHPFTVAFWMRPWSDGNWFAFDTGKESDQNRISLYVRDGDDGKELVLRVCDSTLEQRSAEIVCPLARLGYQPQTWYHLQAEVRGCDATQMELFVDGIAVGRRIGVTYLSAGLSADQDQIPVEDTDGFEAEGALVIGTEIVEYDQRQPDGFTDVVRGARGTRAGEWPTGTAVRRLGYSHPITLELRRGGAGLEQLNWETWNYVQLSAVNPEEQEPVTINGVSLTFFGAKDDASNFTFTAVNPDPNSTTNADQLADAFHSKGFAILAVRDFDPTPPGQAGAGGGGGSGGTSSGPQIGGWEVVYYTRSGTNFTLDRYQSTANHPNSGQPYFAATRVMTPNGEQVWPAYLIPISVLGVSAGRTGIDYLDPMNPLDQQKLAKYAYDGGGGGNDLYSRPRCAVGTADPEGKTEVFTYDSVDRQKAAPAVLFVRDLDADLLALARSCASTTRRRRPRTSVCLPRRRRRPRCRRRAGGRRGRADRRGARVHAGRVTAAVRGALRGPARAVRAAARRAPSGRRRAGPDAGDAGSGPGPRRRHADGGHPDAGGTGPGSGREPPRTARVEAARSRSPAPGPGTTSPSPAYARPPIRRPRTAAAVGGATARWSRCSPTSRGPSRSAA